MKSFITLFVLLIVVSLIVAACGAAGAPAEPVQQAAPTEASAAEAEAAKTESEPAADSAAAVANPEGYDVAACFAAASNNDKTVKFDPKPGPYKIAVSNSFIGNDWRTQMIQMAKAYVEQPHVKPLIEEFSLVSSGQDVAAQIAQMDNMIASGVDAIILNAASPTAFDAVIRRATDAGIIVVSFDNVVTAPEAVLINEDQVEFGRELARDLVKRLNGKGNVVMVTGVAGTSVDIDRTTGGKEVFAENPDIKVVAEVVGNWDTGTAQKVMADLLATRDDIDGVWAQGGTPGVVQAFMDAGKPFVPVAGEAENGFRKQLAEHKDEGLVGISIGQSPGLVAVSIQAALELLQGRELPRVIAAPLPIATTESLETGVNYFPDLPDSFFTPIQFEACGVNLTAKEILAQSAE
ncbi:MAG: ribose ABC transporter substrate-binding protein [Anaerolineae bacterium]|nr:ABC transporter substrate-binding protein [Anaerolineales bacterium]MCQ3976126.1 ribose ABC transporter substrate-binding protein [Anaerolineae bacterium]